MSQKYQKNIYWLNDDEFGEFKERASQNGLKLHQANKAVCVPLSKRVETGFVTPDTWQKFDLCKRQMSWYGESPFVGKTLLVSSLYLADYGLTPVTIIRDSSFRPSRLPDDNEKQELIKQPGYQNIKPDEWEDIANEDPALIAKWLKVMGIRRISYEELFVTHCANHANFIEPLYYIEDEEHGITPYSVSNKTSFICSACLEFYNIIGSNFTKKLVVPCPGASIFAGVPVNRYFEVITLDYN